MIGGTGRGLDRSEEDYFNEDDDDEDDQLAATVRPNGGNALSALADAYGDAEEGERRASSDAAADGDGEQPAKRPREGAHDSDTSAAEGGENAASKKSRPT